MKKSFLNLVAVCGFSLLAMNAYADQGSKGKLLCVTRCAPEQQHD